MKPRAHTFQCLLAALLSLAAFSPLPLPAAPPAAPEAVPGQKPPPNVKPDVKLEIPKSVFVCPKNATQGRDPFFTASTRIFDNNPDNQSKNPGPSLTDLTLKSILGNSPHAFAVINNHTFAPGDEGDVITQNGRRLHIRCVDIDTKAVTVTVEAGGASVTLTLSKAP
ncbi:MAG: hypothetical protein ABSE90_02305 [Verrucomicrobiota bacterium]|jgi:hypothetical protein